MADVYKNFTLEMTTANTAVFTVPEADVANSVPVSTFVCKTIYVVHSTTNPTKTAFTLSHYDASENQTITLNGESKTTEVFNVLEQGLYVFESGDVLYANANANSELVLSASLLEIKQQQ
jgi:hypothetical protein